MTKTLPWTIKKLDKFLKNLKNNKAMDPNGMINEVFKDGFIGTDFKNALIELMESSQINSFQIS